MRRQHRRRLHPLAITALMALALAAVTFYAFNQGLPFVHRFTVNAIVANSVNVRAGDPVRIAGIDVGDVTGVSPAGDATRISFALDAGGLPIHRNATVHIRDRLFLEGSYYLDLDPGTPNAPSLRDGGTIGPAQTSSPVQFFQVLSTFDLAARADLTTLLRSLSEGLGPDHRLVASGAAGLREVTASLRPVLADTAQVTRALRGTAPGDIARLLDSASQVTGTLGASSTQLAGLVTGLARTSAALAASDGALGRSIGGLDATLRAAPPALRAIDTALPPLRRLSVALTPSLIVAPPILRRLDATVAQLAAVLAPEQRTALLTALRATFSRLPTVLTQLGRAFPVGRQVTDCLRTHITPLLETTVPDGSLSSGRPVWQDFVHFLPGVAGASASFDANGPYTRVLAAAGDTTLTGGSGGPVGSTGGGLLGGLLGPIVGTPPPGPNSQLTGSSPLWAGDTTSADFRPDVPCTSQALPSLAVGSAPAPAPMLTRRAPSAAPLNRTTLAARVRAAQRRQP